MRVDFSQEIKTVEGESIPFDKKDKTLLKDLALQVLGLVFRDEQDSLSEEEKIKRWLLKVKIVTSPDTELTIDEAALIKKRIGKAYGPDYVGPAFKILEGK